MFWLMIVKHWRPFKYIKAEPPCMKGELTFPLWKYYSVTIGWQKGEEPK